MSRPVDNVSTARPTRVRLARARNASLPPGCKVVSRPSRFGNPFLVGTRDAPTPEAAVRLFRQALLAGELGFSIADAIRELAGLDLACWCPLDQPCHADVLIEVANF